jgi:ABC-type cobalamin/Fe3+-siderophores transport system ATPase subunit
MSRSRTSISEVDGKNRLAVVVMHDLDLAFRFFERVIVMQCGRVVVHGLARDLVENLRLDAAFGVTFERLQTPYGSLLRVG